MPRPLICDNCGNVVKIKNEKIMLIIVVLSAILFFGCGYITGFFVELL